MIHPNHSPDIEPVYQLLDGYSFDVEAYPIDFVIAGWLDQYGPVWVSHAITEALYQGRYKIISIEQILKLWQRRGQPIRHFNREFESIILGQALLCPTGYGDSTEGQTTPVTPKAEDAAPLAPLPTAEDKLAPGATDYLGRQGEPHGAESADRAAPRPPNDAPSTNPFAAAAPGQTIPNFRPLVPDFKASWPQTDEIPPFVPRQDGSELHQRLRAVVRGGMGE